MLLLRKSYANLSATQIQQYFPNGQAPKRQNLFYMAIDLRGKIGYNRIVAYYTMKETLQNGSVLTYIHKMEKSYYGKH